MNKLYILATRDTPPAPPAPSATATPARPQPSDEQMLAVERQLLCPLCVNERLDVCTTAVCADMKEIIREVAPGMFVTQ